ncbi:unnamed protein product [Schistosoma mattheei]|uniref:SH2 domain-containing protein n=1 Tax=Schistosoma mattheei TaxID=31246 RepID=A0AA85B3N8_9TREM|nr:unnamed protein product [Schistosoma mattheei]
MDQKSNINLFHPALINLTTHLFYNIIEHRINAQNFKCLGLQSIDYEQKENQIEVVLQFDIISSSSSASSSTSRNNSLGNNNNNTYTECDYTNLFGDKLAEQITSNERKSPFVTIVVCCCILTTFFLLVLFLRCRSFIRRKQLLKRRRNPKYLYCSKYPKSKPINHCYIKANNSCYWSPTKPKHSHSFSVWSEGQPLKYHQNKHRISSTSSLNQFNLMVNSSQSHFYSNNHCIKDPKFIHRQSNSSTNVINNSNERNFMKYNYHQHDEIYGMRNRMNIGYLEYSKRINNAKSTMFPNSQRLIVPSKQSNSSAIGNQSMFFNSQKITNENDITDSETPTTEFTESSKSHKSISQINVYRKGRSLSPADITNFKESKFHFSPKPRFSLAESDEMNNQPIENSQSSGFRDVIIDCSSLESAISYPVQNSCSHLNENKNLDSSLESRSLMSVYLNDVAQKNRIVTPTVTITTTNINNTVSENNTSTIHNISLDNSNYNNVITLSPLNLPKIDTGIFNDELYNTEKMNSFESNQLTYSTNTDHNHMDQHNNFTYDLQSPVIKEKPKRPVLCLFSANKYNQKRHLKRNNSISNDDSNDDTNVDDDNNNGNIHDTKQDIDVRRLRQGTNISTTKLSVTNQINRIIGSSNNINNNDNLCNHNLNLLLCNTNECKSCVNLQAYELSQDRYRNPSSGSTVSQIPRSDLPDVYLNPPSMSTLQSQRSSLCGRSRMELLYVDNELDRTNNPRCKLSTNGIISSSNLGENLSDVIDSDHRFSVQHTNGAGDNWSSVDELVIFPQPQTLGLVRNQTFNSRNTYHQPLPQSSSNLAPSFFKPYQLIDDNFGNLPVKDKEHHISIQQQLRRALSLSSRRKSPRSLNEEIQSIMDKHYEMTGIRMTIGSGSSQKNSTTTKSYINLFGLQTGNKTQPSRPRKRRCSWTFTKDITNEFQTSLKNVSSALHLDCPTFDLFQKFKHNRDKPSVLESLSMTALPCLIPLRPRIQSDITNDMTSINEELITKQSKQKFHPDLYNIKLIDFKRNSIGINDKSVILFGIQKNNNIRLVKSNWNLTNL